MNDSPATTPDLPPGIDRRGFLRTTAGGTAAILVGSMIPAGCAADYPQANGDALALQALSPKEYAVARAAAEALLVGVPVDPAAVASGIDRELALVGEPILGDMKTVLSLLEHATFLNGHFRRFTELDPETRRRDLEGWATSRFNLRRGAYQAVKAFVYFFAYAQDSTRELTGFPGPWTERVKLAPYPVEYGEVV